MQYIVVEVRCHACGELIATPAEADLDLFRAGVHVHARPSCLATIERRLEDAAHERELRRERDRDDGVIWEDDM